MTSTCLVCYQDSQVFILPPCNHRDICWKCCLKLVKGSIFVCPFCNDKPDIKSQLLFVSSDEMQTKEHQVIMKNSPFRSNKNTFYFYSNAEVAEYIESQTSFHCVKCGEVHETINLLKKHLYSNHKLQFCDVCLDNRRCIITEQHLYTQGQLMVHLKQGDISETGQVILYHPKCQFCQRPFYDIQSFKLHLKMSSHMKCQICEVNTTKLKYVYYRDYPELQLHHRKTHFVCYVGDCVGKKLENVFASQALLQQHKRKCHRKYKGDKNQKVQNILLGFNKTLEQQHIQFDGIGRNLEKQFTIFQRQQKVQKQVHNDQFIDIRQFYPEMCKNNTNVKSQDIAARVIQLIHSYGAKPKDVHFNQIHLFKPLEMPSLSRIQCEKMIKRCFQLRDAEAIIQIFFTKRNQYHSFDEFFQAIEKRMKSYSPFAFYYIFPQLIRFMKDQNKNKAPMDEYYSIKLRLLVVNRLLLFHAFDRYSQLIQFLRNQLQCQMKRRCEDTSLNLQKYSKYMKQMNINYYINEQDELFFVSKQKATNLYHMIERCKTKDFLKMNWLLKLGLSQQTYQHMMKNVYSKTKQQCEDNIFKPYRMKQMALMSLYLKICLQSLNDKISFEQNKRNAKAYYLTEFLDSIPRPANISPKILNEIRMLQGCSHNIQKKTKQRTTKMIVVNDEDCPSLLRPQTVKAVVSKKNIEAPELGLGKSTLPIWNEEQSLRKKKNPIQPQKNIQEQDNFPALVVPEETKTQKGRSKANSKRITKDQQQDFPVYNFKEKFVTPEPTNKIEEKKNNISEFLGFNSKLVVNNAWDQNKTRQRLDQYQKIKESQVLNKKGNKKNQVFKAQSDPDQDQYFKLAIQQSLKTAAQENKGKNKGKKQEKLNNQSFKKQVEQIKVEQMEMIIPKKNNKIQQQKPEKKNKQKNKKEEVKVENSNGKKQEPQFLFQQIQKEANIISKKTKQPRLRIDYSDDSEENIKVQQKKIQVVQKPPQQRYLNKNVVQLDDDQFMTIGSITQGKQSIINKIQKQSSQNQEKKNNKVVKNGKKGKVIIETVRIF